MENLVLYAEEKFTPGGREHYQVKCPMAIDNENAPILVGKTVTIAFGDTSFKRRINGIMFQPTAQPRYVIDDHLCVSVEPCQHEWKNHIRTEYKGVYLSVCQKCGQSEEYEKDYT